MLAASNGRIGNPKGGEQSLLEFSIDVMLDRGDDIDVLFTHELFHLYHLEKSQLWSNAQKDDENFLNLWTEGLATFASGVVVPNKSDGVLLFDAKLGQVPESKLPELARKFLEMAKDKPTDGPLWFRTSKTWRDDMPPRTGYLLGFNISRQRAKKFTLREMASWRTIDVKKTRTRGIGEHRGSKVALVDPYCKTAGSTQQAPLLSIATLK